MSDNIDNLCENFHSPKYRQGSEKKLFIVLAIISIFMLVEIVAGLYTHSLALLADAGHILCDIASIMLSLLAMWFACKKPTINKTFGYFRTEILASLVNGVVLVLITFFVVYEAVRRLNEPHEVLVMPMLIVSIVGLAINFLAMKLLHANSQESLNVKAVYLELLGDLLGSLAVLIASLVIMFTSWWYADPIASILIAMIILHRTWKLLSECTNILMEGTPAHIDLAKLHTALANVNGVIEVHDIHVWTITSGLESMSGHVIIAKSLEASSVLKELTRIAQEEFGIRHTTIQVEYK